MELEIVSTLLRSLILEHDRVSLPTIGSFVAELTPAIFIEEEERLTPPDRRIQFKQSEIWNDTLLEREYAQAKGLSIEEGRRELTTLIERIKEALESKRSLYFPNFGTLRSTEEKLYFFVVDRELFTYNDSFGLESVKAEKLDMKGEIEELEKGVREGPSFKVIIVVVVVVLLVAATIALFLFKEQLQPLLERLLYSKEERELLRFIK